MVKDDASRDHAVGGMGVIAPPLAVLGRIVLVRVARQPGSSRRGGPRLFRSSKK
jgi:hypothetical protein